MLERKNFIWNTIGTILFGFTSLFFLIIITRINGVDDAGIYSYAFANASIFATIGFFAGRTFQVTERNNKISDSDYLYNHLTTFIIMMFCALLFCLISRSSIAKFSLIIILCLYRGIETIIDSIHAIIQRNGELYKAGISLVVRTILLVLSLFLIDYFTHNMYLAASSLIVINLLFLIIDYQNIKGKYSKSKFSFVKNNSLLKAGVAVFLYQFLTLYVINASKYAINTYEVDSIQAIYGIISMPASFLVLISNYLLVPFLNKITTYLKDNDYANLKKLINKLMLLLLGIGLLALGACYLIGIPLLEFVYGISLSHELGNLMIIIIGSIFYSETILLSSVFVALRKTNTQLIILIIIALITIIVSNFLVKVYGLYGASLAYTIMMVLEFILHYMVLFFIVL